MIVAISSLPKTILMGTLKFVKKDKDMLTMTKNKLHQVISLNLLLWGRDN